LHGIYYPKAIKTTLPDGMLSNPTLALPVNVRRLDLCLINSAGPYSRVLVLRLGKPLEHLQAALRASQNTAFFGEQVTTIGRQLAYFGYLSYDTAIWVRVPTLLIHRWELTAGSMSQANAIKFIKLDSDTAAKINRTSNRFWFAGILFSIIHAVLKVRNDTAAGHSVFLIITWIVE
jgi:hypothetical protein